MAEGFEWVVVTPERVRETRADVTAVSARLLACLPDAALVVLPARGGSVQVLGVSGEVLDLSGVPFELVEYLCSVFGPGVYRVARPGQNACRVVGRKPG
jgi:hypothetical protein